MCRFFFHAFESLVHRFTERTWKKNETNDEKMWREKKCNCVECSIAIIYTSVTACTVPTNCAIISWNSYMKSLATSHTTQHNPSIELNANMRQCVAISIRQPRNLLAGTRSHVLDMNWNYIFFVVDGTADAVAAAAIAGTVLLNGAQRYIFCSCRW